MERKTVLFFLVILLSAGASSGLLFGENLNLDYSTYLGGSDDDCGYGISLGPDGRIYLIGDTRSSDFPRENPYQAGLGGSKDVFVSILSSSGSSLYYSTYLGGSSSDYGRGISLGPDGRIYVTGETGSSDFPTENPYQAGFGGAQDVFVSALTSSGSALYYSTYLGGNSFDYGRGISLGSAGAASVVGYTNSSNFPMKNPYQASTGGNKDVFVSTLTSSGSTLYYSTYLGGSGADYGNGISLGSDGVAYVAGETGSSDFPTLNPYQAGFGGGEIDVFVSALISSGSALSYSTYLGGSSLDWGYGISLGPDGRIYVAGYTSSSDFPTLNPYQAGFGGGDSDVFVSALISSGSALSYSTYLGGSGFDWGYGISLGPDGKTYITGKTSSSDFPTLNPYQAGFGGGDSDVFVSALISSGSALSYSTYLGGSNNDCGYGISLSPDGKTYVAGETESTDFPMENPYQAVNGGSLDAFVSRLTMLTPGVTPTPFVTPNPSVTPTPSITPTPSFTPTPTPNATPTPSEPPPPSVTPSATPIPSLTPTPTPDIPSNPQWIYDYNGDGTSDIAIFRESSGLWAIRDITRLYFGTDGDNPQPGDYDGDGTTDLGLYRPSSGLWALRSVSRIYFGGSADRPIPADYDGDGTSDPAIFRSASGLWAVRGITRTYFGGSLDEPIPGYYGGRGEASIAIYRPASGLWAFQGVTRIYFGSSTDYPVPGDYDGDGAWLPGIFRESSGLWALVDLTRTYFGGGLDWAVPGEYSGDGTDDIGIFRESSGLWAIRGITRVYFGGSSDIPVTR